MALAVELPHAIASVPADLARTWGRSADELLRIGKANVERSSVERDRVSSGELAGFILTSSTAYTVPSQVLFLGNHLGRHYPAGALVAMPTRQALVCFPLGAHDRIRNAETVAATVTVVHGWFNELASEARYSESLFSSELYWWRDGALQALPAGVTPRGPVIAPPAELMAALLADQPKAGGTA